MLFSLLDTESCPEMLPWVTSLRGEKGEGHKGPPGPPSPVCEMEEKDVGWSVWTLLVSNPMSPWKKVMAHPGESETEGATHMNTHRETRRETNNTGAQSRERSKCQGLPPVSGWASPLVFGVKQGIVSGWHFRVLVNDLRVETGLGISSCRFCYHFPKDVSWWQLNNCRMIRGSHHIIPGAETTHPWPSQMTSSVEGEEWVRWWHLPQRLLQTCS